MDTSNYLLYTEKGNCAPRPNLPYVIRETIALVVKHSNQYLFLTWNNVEYSHSLVTGGINSNEEKEEAAKRELVEETGYYDIDSIKPIDALNIAHFYAEHKNENRKSFYYPYLVILKSLKRKSITEQEKKEHNCIWIDEKELKNIDLFDNHRYMLENGQKLTVD